MADVRNLTTQELERQNQLLKERDEILQRLDERNKRIAVAGADEIKRLEKRNEKDKEHLQSLDNELDTIKAIKDGADEYVKTLKDALDRQEELTDLQDEYATSFAKMTPAVQKILTSQERGGGAYAAITAKILELKKQQINADDEERATLEQRIKSLQTIRQTHEDAAEGLASEKEDFFGITEAARRRQEFQSSIVGMSEEDRRIAEQIYIRNEAILAQQERLVELKNQQNSLVKQLPEGLQNALSAATDFVKGLAAGLGPIVLLGALLTAAVVEFTALEEAAGKFREETGLTKSATKDIAEQAEMIRSRFADLGATAEDYYNTIKAISGEFGDTARFSDATVSSIVVLNKNFAVAQKDAAAVNMLFQSMAGLSDQTAQNVSMQLVDLAEMSGVAPAKVFEDIAESAEESYTYFRGDINALYRSAIEARRLGTNLKSVLKTAEGLLDFENGIEKELVAATFVGGQFNLNRARALAFAGKEVDAQKEILNQIQRSGDFASKDVFTKKALADAANMTVGEIQKQLLLQERLNNATDAQKKLVSEAMDKGLDITNLNENQLKDKVKELETQKEIVDQISNMENKFQSIVAQLGSALLPVLEAITPILTAALTPITWAAEGIKMLIDGLKQGSIAAYTLVGVLAAMSVKSIIGAIAAIFTGFGAMGPFGVALAGLAVAGMMNQISKAKQAVQVGDMSMDSENSGGKTMISTREGGIFEPSANDQIAIGPDVLQKLNSAGNKSGIGKVVESNTGGFGGAINVLVNEMKQLRNDMNSGKIRTNTYLDGYKVSTNLATANNETSRNSFSYGQRG